MFPERFESAERAQLLSFVSTRAIVNLQKEVRHGCYCLDTAFFLLGILHLRVCWLLVRRRLLGKEVPHVLDYWQA